MPFIFGHAFEYHPDSGNLYTVPEFGHVLIGEIGKHLSQHEVQAAIRELGHVIDEDRRSSEEGSPCREKGNSDMSKYWRPLTQEEIAGLVEGDALLIRQNYLWNPERRPVTYVEATYVAKVKRAVIQILEKGSDTPICVGPTEVGRLYDDGWHMTPEEWGKIKSIPGSVVRLVL